MTVPRGLILIALLSLVLSGCTSTPPAPTSSSTADSTPPAADSCAPYPRPQVRSGAAFSPDNAFDFMVGLVCDHSNTPARERFRVPGTDGHRDAMTYLFGALDQHSSFSVRYDNFTGAQYQAIMDRKNTDYHAWYNGCSAADKARVKDLRFGNVEARGGTTGGPIFLLMAHWDSKRAAEDTNQPFVSANDGPSGVGILLELARILSVAAIGYEVRILLTDGEDGFDDCHPLAGSTWYSETQVSATDKNRLRSILLLDMVGDAAAQFYKGCGSDTALADRIWAKAKEMNVEQFRQSAGCSGVDDHTPFEERGMKTVDVIDGRPNFTPYWHTSKDTPDKVSAEMLGDVGRVVEAIVRAPV